MITKSIFSMRRVGSGRQVRGWTAESTRVDGRRGRVNLIKSDSKNIFLWLILLNALRFFKKY